MWKKGVLRNLENFTGKHLCWSLQQTPTQVFSCKICKISKNPYFEENTQTTASIRSNRNQALGDTKSFITFSIFSSCYDYKAELISPSILIFSFAIRF